MNLLVIKFIFTVCIAILVGLVLLILFPVFAKNQPLLFILPVVEVFFLFLIIKPKEILAGLLLVRPLLDLILERTKVSFGGTDVGAGSALNFAVIFLAILFKFQNQNSFKSNLVIKFWFLYLFFLFIAAYHSPYLGTAIRALIDNTTYFVMFIIPMLIVKSHEDFKFWMKIIALSFVLPVMVGNVDLLIWHGRYFPDSGRRIEGSFGHPNILAFFLAFGLMFYFYILQSKLFKFNRRIYFFSIVLMLNMLVLLCATKTRNAWIACFIGFFIYGLLKDRKLVLILLLVTPLSMFIPSIHQRVVNIFDPSTALNVNYRGINSYQWRLEMWKSCIPKILEQPLQGYGLTSFKPMSAQFSTVGENGAHNVYLELFFETGVFGFLSFIFIFLSLLGIFWKRITQSSNFHNSKLAAIAFSYVLSYMIICSADNLMYYLAFNWYVWFFFGLILLNERNLTSV